MLVLRIYCGSSVDILGFMFGVVDGGGGGGDGGWTLCVFYNEFEYVNICVEECNVKTIIPCSSKPHGYINKYHATPHTHTYSPNYLQTHLNLFTYLEKNEFRQANGNEYFHFF